ncbi:MAG: zinc ribbon domain-containing protein [bacterium]
MLHILKYLTFMTMVTGCFVVLPVSGGAFAQEAQVPSSYKSVPPERGERCLICGVELTDEDVVLIVRGRKVPLNRAMVDSFMQNQEHFFKKLLPKSAFFYENFEVPAEIAQGGISRGWFLFGIYILTALIFSGLSGYTAIAKGLPPVPHYFIGFVFSLLGFLYVWLRPASVAKGEIPAGLVKVPNTSSAVACIECGHDNHPSAHSCSGCGAPLEPSCESEVSKVT